MSSVNSSDYGGYYVKHLSELEDELKRDYARKAANAREELGEIEEKYRKSSQKRDEMSDEAVSGVRDRSQTRYDKETESQRAEIEKIRAMNYDKYGRNRAYEAEETKEQLKLMKESTDASMNAEKRAHSETQASYQNRIDILRKQFGDQNDRNVEQARDSSFRAFQEAFDGNRNAAAIQRNTTEKRLEEMARTRMEELNEQRHDSERVLKGAKDDTDNRILHQELALNQRISESQRNQTRKLETEAKELRDAAEGQTRKLRDQLSDLVSAESNYVKERGQGRSDAIREYEDDWRTRERLMQENREQEVEKFQEMSKRAEDHSFHLNDRNLHERNDYFTHLLARTTSENRETTKDIEKRYAEANNQIEKRMKGDSSIAQKHLEESLHDAFSQRDHALQNQALAYETTLENQRSMDGDKIKSLEGDIHRRMASKDAKEIPPEIEDAIRNKVSIQFDQSLTAEQNRNKRVISDMYRSNTDKLRTSQEDSDRLLRELTHKATRDVHQANSKILETAVEAEYEKNQAIRTVEQDEARQRESLARLYGQSTNRQKAEYEVMMQNMRDDASVRIQSLQQEYDFNTKIAQRSFSAKQNELIRDTEKKLTDQKLEFDGKHEVMRLQMQQGQSEADRKLKTSLEEQAKSYDQRIAMMQAQQKERERSIAQNYEDEIEKVKRANAIIQAKKG